MKDHHRVRAFIDDLKVNLDALTFDCKGDIIAIKVLGVWVTKNFIVEKCSGLKDKNDKLIYEEGDIYKLPDGSTGPMHRILAAYLVSKSHLLGAPHKVYEIIGNIHENPELLGLPPKQ